MPTDHVEMMEGRSIEQMKKLLAEITRVSVAVLAGAAEPSDGSIAGIRSARLIGRKN